MAKGKEEKDSIKYKYIFKDDYNPRYANGAYGGLTPRGEISINFFYERPALPKEQIHEMQDGNIGQLISNVPADNAATLVRVIENGVILNLQTAKQVVSWLQLKIETIEKVLKEENKNDITSK